ncbi:MAG: hypothetical protein HYV09_16770 [Deltaproteobacteria bacterium]|nr:hypothetical protein [Deltaproteobacteria bacterium]
MAQRVVRFVLGVAAAVTVACTVSPEDGDPTGRGTAGSHSWSTYHWEIAGKPFPLSVGENLTTTNWEGHLATTVADWNGSVVQMSIVPGGAKNCRPTGGRVEVCNRKYGFNGWLGLAQVWLYAGHIYQAVVKVNDSYFLTTTYNNENAKLHVMCQEVGHVLGLDHQHGDARSCMNGAGLFEGAYAHPDSHDLQQLGTIYSHVHETSTATAATTDDGAASFGRAIAQTETETLFELELGGGHRKLTWVRWAK